MTPEEHSKQISEEFARRMREKYMRGQKEHKDKLWELSVAEVVNELEDELLDLANYIVDFKMKLRNLLGDEMDRRR